MYGVLGQNRIAINDFTKAIQIGSSYDANAYDSRGLVYRRIGEAANADADDAKACSLDSKYC
jgi:Flp pilus assembly protein TadD